MRHASTGSLALLRRIRTYFHYLRRLGVVVIRMGIMDGGSYWLTFRLWQNTCVSASLSRSCYSACTHDSHTICSLECRTLSWVNINFLSLEVLSQKKILGKLTSVKASIHKLRTRLPLQDGAVWVLFSRLVCDVPRFGCVFVLTPCCIEGCWTDVLGRLVAVYQYGNLVKVEMAITNILCILIKKISLLY